MIWDGPKDEVFLRAAGIAGDAKPILVPKDEDCEERNRRMISDEVDRVLIFQREHLKKERGIFGGRGLYVLIGASLALNAFLTWLVCYLVWSVATQ